MKKSKTKRKRNLLTHWLIAPPLAGPDPRCHRRSAPQRAQLCRRSVVEPSRPAALSPAPQRGEEDMGVDRHGRGCTRVKGEWGPPTWHVLLLWLDRSLEGKGEKKKWVWIETDVGAPGEEGSGATHVPVDSTLRLEYNNGKMILFWSSLNQLTFILFRKWAENS